MSYSQNGELEVLIEQITDAIVARLNGAGSDQASLCGCTSECFNRCPERMHRVVDAGAARLGLVLGETASARDWASLIDHTLLKPEATDEDIKHLCEEAARYRFASVCVNPTWVRAAACNLHGSGVPVCTVIGFPLGATLSDVKAYEARRTIFDGAREVITIDGLRVEYPDGFGLARPSNTTPVVVLRFEADDEAAMKRIQEDFRRAILADKQDAALPF